MGIFGGYPGGAMGETLGILEAMGLSRAYLRRLYGTNTLAEASAEVIEFCQHVFRSDAVCIEIPALKIVIQEPANYFAEVRPLITRELKIPLDIHSCYLGTLTIHLEDLSHVPAEAEVILVGTIADFLAHRSLKQMLANERIASLTIMERRVFYHMRLRTKEIAQELGIGASTVYSHIKQIYKKLGVSKKIEVLSLLDMLG